MQWKISGCRRLNVQDTGRESWEMSVRVPAAVIFFALSSSIFKIVKILFSRIQSVCLKIIKMEIQLIEMCSHAQCWA